MSIPTLASVNIKKQSAVIELSYHNQERYQLSFEFLRVHSPSADVRGHSGSEGVLQYGKSDVRIDKIEQVGNYGLQMYFDDLHHSGIYTWGYLYHLATQQESLYETYLQALEKAGKSRLTGAINVIDLLEQS